MFLQHLLGLLLVLLLHLLAFCRVRFLLRSALVLLLLLTLNLLAFLLLLRS
jgi:hypothetical protein